MAENFLSSAPTAQEINSKSDIQYVQPDSTQWWDPFYTGGKGRICCQDSLLFVILTSSQLTNNSQYIVGCGYHSNRGKKKKSEWKRIPQPHPLLEQPTRLENQYRPGEALRELVNNLWESGGQHLMWFYQPVHFTLW